MKYTQKKVNISACGTYRYSLERRWGETQKRVVFIGLNPSVADGIQDDNTIRRCVGFADEWGYTCLTMINLFAYRATNPVDMRKAGYDGKNIVGPSNDQHIVTECENAELVVACWGAHGGLDHRDVAVTDLLSNQVLVCLGRTKDKKPRHPLYLSKDTTLIKFN